MGSKNWNRENLHSPYTKAAFRQRVGEGRLTRYPRAYAKQREKQVIMPASLR
jgi:hypothetical protein